MFLGAAFDATEAPAVFTDSRSLTNPARHLRVTGVMVRRLVRFERSHGRERQAKRVAEGEKRDRPERKEEEEETREGSRGGEEEDLRSGLLPPC